MQLRVRRLLSSWLGNRDGSIVPTFALALVPMIGLAGAAVDYSRATGEKTRLQAALDSGVLAGAADGTSAWQTTAQNAFQSTYLSLGGSTASGQFSSSGTTYSGSASITVPTRLLTPIGYRSLTVAAASSALVTLPQADASCFLSLGQGMAKTDNSMTFSGSPNVTLTGCALRSNTSMKCNGHDTGALSSASAGTTTSCSNPASGATVVGDVYKSIAANITTKCTSTSNGITWRPGSPPNSTKMVTVYLADRTEYHVCGDLTLSGTGSLTGASPANDTIIVIENGSLTISQNAAISATRTAIVFTGNNTVSSSINFPQGNGQSASLSLSPPTTDTDPWAGMSLYQNPSLTYRVDSSWGPGASLSADGIVYLPNATLSLGGNASSGSTGCTKIVANQVVMGGAVDVKQSPAACSSIKVQQWAIPKNLAITG